ncbi:hypothetical protein [Flavobacterium sp.]|uniref:hypothetical protein n=1 Tax=Flavobacterium sp. TaxID=239 RepID=UPI002636AC48|nr:hypothetical protein [Flavobacterium sp.]
MIWYACYGSNMDLQRFLIYLQGGQLEVNGVMKPYRRCDDDFEEPGQTEPYVIHRRFYFAKESGTWDNHGVGFISTKKDMRSLTYARLYLISEIQFKHLFAAENGRRTTNIDFAVIDNNKSQDFDYNFYNRIIQLEDNYKGHPVMTFTNKEILAPNNPMGRYLQLISDGLEAVHQLNANVIAAYFKKSNVKMSKSSIHKILTAKKSS